MNTLVIDVINKTIPMGYHQNIPIINETNPCYGYTATSDQIKQLLQMPNYYIYEAGTDKLIDGTNYYDYFPEEGGGGGGGVTIDTLWSDSNGATVGTEYTMTGSINDYDEIVLKVACISDINNFNTYDQYSFKVAMIGPGEQIQCTSYGMRYITTTVSDNKFTVTRSGTANESEKYTPIIWEIIGIKY